MVNLDGAPVTAVALSTLAEKYAALGVAHRKLKDLYESDPSCEHDQFLCRFYTDSGAELVCVVTYEAGERQTNDCPGEPESVEITAVYCNGADLTDVISSSLNPQLEQCAWDTLENARAEARIAAWEASHD